MKRKTKRQWKKKWTAIVAPFGILAFLFLLIKDSVFPLLKPKLMGCFFSPGKEDSATFLLYATSGSIIILLSLIITRIYLHLTSPDEKYFKYIDFEKPHDEVIRRATVGILNSEKSQPEFVHVAPVNDEIGIFSKQLDANDFVWENGKPGEGKTMLAYHALYRLRYPVGFTCRGYYVTLTKRRYKVYKLNMERVGDKSEINAILEELDYLDGGKHKIILIDDAHKLDFEDELRYEFEQEAKEKKNGKFVWINTNYFESKDSETDDAIRIDFDKFYPRLIEDLYHSKHPVISKVVEQMATGLQEAINLKHQGKISDPWHFNFIATAAVNRINNLLEKLSANKTEQDILVMSLFLFSARNIMSGEKEINLTEFADILGRIRIASFRTNINRLTPEYIITQLSSQDKGRFIIIENRSKMDKGFLHAPHYKLSIAVVRSILTHFTDHNFLHQVLEVTQVLLKTNNSDTKYFSVFFRTLGDHQQYFLEKNGEWITQFLSHPLVEQINAYHLMLIDIKKKYPGFYKSLINENIVLNYAETISRTGASKFKAIQEIIRALGSDSQMLIEKLDWDHLAESANKAETHQLSQVAHLLFALKIDGKKLIEKLDWDRLAESANNAKVNQISQIADLVKALKINRNEFVDKLDWSNLAHIVNKTEAHQFEQAAALIIALGDERNKLVDKLDWDRLAKSANNTEPQQLRQVADLIFALKADGKKFIEKLDWGNMIQIVNKAEVHQFEQAASFIIALGEERNKLLDELDWDRIAQIVNNAEASEIKKIGDFINSLKDQKHRLVDKLNWDNLARTANKVKVHQLSNLETLLNAIGDKKNMIIDKLDWKSLAQSVNNAEVHQFAQLEAILNALDADSQNLVAELDWDNLIQTANKAEVQQFTQIAQFLNSIGGNKRLLIAKMDWSLFANKINNTEDRQLTQVADLINALDEDKDSLVVKLDLEKLAQSANKVQVHQLKQVTDFINALGNERFIYTNSLNNDWLIKLSTLVEKHQLIPFSTLISLLETEKQSVLIEQIDWISFLKKIAIHHNNDVKCLAAILFFINKKQDKSNGMEHKRIISEQLAGYHNLVYYATNYFISPDDFNYTAKLIKSLIPFGSDLPQRIINLLKEKIISDFKINSLSYQGFANLLEAIKEVDYDVCKEILENPVVMDKLIDSINSEDLTDKSEYLNNMLEMIKGIYVPSFESIMKNTKPL